MEKIKILYLIMGFFPGGTELILEKILNKLNKKRYKIIICSLIDTREILDKFRKFSNSIYILNIKNFFDLFSALLDLRYILQKEKPHILHSFLPLANLIGRLAAINIPCYVISSIRARQFEKKYFILLDFLTQYWVDVYVVNSKSLLDFEKKHGINKKKLILIENGIDFKNFKQKKKIYSLKKSLNIDKSLIITMVAHLRKQKDYPTTLKALGIIKNKIDFCFLSVGKANKFEDETKKIERIVKKLNLENNVKFLGYRNDIPDILALSDIWVSSTLYEGQSNSLLEAMALKIPIITTNIPENAEIVRHENEAILVPPKNPARLAKAIIKLNNNKILAENLANKAYRRVHKKYNLKKTVKKLELLYYFLIKN